MRFSVKIDGVSKTLMTFDGEDGPFYVAEIGSIRELPNGIFYGDDQTQICLYFEISSRPNDRYALNIFHTTKERFGGGVPLISVDRVKIAKKNISKFFSLRNPIFFHKDVQVGPEDIIFTWEIG